MMFSRSWFRHFLVLIALLTGATLALAQSSDAEFARALTTLYANGFTAGLIKDWCDDRAADLRPQNARALEAWRSKMGLDEIDAQVTALLVDRKAAVDASLEQARAGVYAQLDAASQSPAADCANLERELNTDLNLRVEYANEYKIVAARTKSGSSGSSTGAGSGTALTNSASKLPTLPAFDFVQFAKLGLDPSRDPVPDEYRCYARTPGDQYVIPNAILHVLPGRKYRFALAATVYEGTFALVDGTRVVFNSGLLANQNKEYNKYNFDRRTGASINLQELRVGNEKIDFSCPQRGAKDRLEQLRFKRKDPQPGVFACVRDDEPEKSLGTLELLPNRRYRTDGGEGTYGVDITGKSDDSSDVRFIDGPVPDDTAYYRENEDGRQTLSLRRSLSAFRRVTIECVRRGTPRPNPALGFGSNKAPPAPGKGGLEGRFFVGRVQVSIGGYTPCGGVCYDFAFFQKDGYVYNDDAEDTGGLEDSDCTRTYPSGFPVCQTYSIAGGTANKNMIKIGFEKPVTFKRAGKTVEIDGDEYGLLESLDGAKFDGYYSSVTGGGSSNGTSSSGFTSSVDLVLRRDGRFSRDAASNTYASGSFLGETTVFAGSSNSKSNTGTYRVYGNTIEFKYEDGRVVKQFIFAPAGRKDLEYLRIGGRLYWLDKDRQ